MTKTEMHSALKGAGAKLKGINAYSSDELAALHAAQFGQPKPDADKATANAKAAETQKMHVLFFDRSGWCEEAKKSYFQGVYHPSDVKDYLAMRKFAQREGAQMP